MNTDILERFRLDGKKALVTGGGQGIGRGLALALAQAGADVAIADINTDAANRVALEVESLGRKSLSITADVSRRADAQRMVQEAVDCFGRLDIAVNNVGVSLKIGDTMDVTEEDWDWLFGANLKGTFFCAQAEAKAMMPNKHGKIVNLGSICGHIVWPEWQTLYSTSKAGVIHMTRCLAAEWIQHGIRVNSISPGVTRTPDLFPEVIPIFLGTAPIDRIAEVEDIQGALLYLVSEVSDFVTGHDLVIDGGYTIM